MTTISPNGKCYRGIAKARGFHPRRVAEGVWIYYNKNTDPEEHGWWVVTGRKADMVWVQKDFLHTGVKW